MDAIDESAGALEWPDYAVLGIVLCVSASIGVYYRFSGGRQKTAEEYFSADRSMSVPLLAIALMVAFMSAIAMLGISGEIYIYGSQFTLVNLGFSLGTPFAAFLYLPVFYHLQTMSIYEYLQRRFGMTARLVASLTNFVQMVLYTGVVLYAPALALEATTGLSSMMSVLVIGLICTFYSSIGGMKAVLATDVFQGVLMFASLFCIIGVAWYDFEGGFLEIWSKAGEGGRLEFLDFSLDPTQRHTFWGLMIGGAFFFLSNFAVNQIMIQRLLAARSLVQAQLALFLNVPLTVSMSLVTSLAGLALYAWFKDCDPVASGKVYSFDQVMPYFAKIRMSQIPGLSGFFIAGVFSASLSTVSAMINSLAAVAVADYIKPLYAAFGHDLSDSTASLLGKVFGTFNGLLILAVAYLASQLGSIMQLALAINGAMGGPLLGLFSLGIFVESANEAGSVIGILLSLAFSLWVVFGSPKPPVLDLPVSVANCSTNLTAVDTALYDARLFALMDAEDGEYFYPYRISYMWYTPLGMVTTMLFGYIASLFVCCCAKVQEPDPDLFTPVIASCMRRRNAGNTKRNSFVMTPSK
ncbi:putative sodium-dependent multivitamin transporter [Venturia canescens]|uniref:putative sodium-dependent multivitamin transporter n=1 Tax=Venturia canescens TaxID=32260 RepID=UPI001C9C43FD|nr:putative sodium-dependent multivitamin transporter [Venturia canescens]XP_043284490.1 putative sodium-dependent multivitamin transporter [Venturia canescens]